MDFGAGTEVLLGVCEEVVRTGAGEEGATDFGVCYGELRGAGGGSSAHELFCEGEMLAVEDTRGVGRLRKMRCAVFNAAARC